MSRQTDSFYDRFSALYPVVDLFLRPQKKVLFGEINKLPEGNLLEIGVGNGAHFPLYKKHQVSGIDTSAAMLERARKRAGDNISVFQMSGEALLFADNEFDYVVLSHVIAVVDDAGQLLAEVHRVLQPQGRLYILNHFTPANGLKNIDRLLARLSKRLHFKSVFQMEDIPAIQRFDLVKDIPLGFASYFKLKIYQKK